MTTPLRILVIDDEDTVRAFVERVLQSAGFQPTVAADGAAALALAASSAPFDVLVTDLGALGGFFPPLLLGWCIATFGTPAWAYVAMSLFALAAFAVNWWFYWRAASPAYC